MKFKSLTNKPVRIALLTGHVTTVGIEFKELNERFHRDAYALGCISEDMMRSAAAEAIPAKMAENIVRTHSKAKRLAEVIGNWVDGNDLKHFSKSTGKPNAMALSDALGEQVSGVERDEAWCKFEEGKEVE